MPRTSVDAPAVGIESTAKRVGTAGPHATSLVTCFGSSTIGPSYDGAGDVELCHTGGGQGTPATGVNCGLVVGVVVDAFYDIDLATCRPIRPVAPKGCIRT